MSKTQSIVSGNLELKAEVERWAKAICPEFPKKLSKPIWSDGYLFISNGVMAIRFVAPYDLTDCITSDSGTPVLLKKYFDRCKDVEYKTVSIWVTGDRQWWSQPVLCETCEGSGEAECPECGHLSVCGDCGGYGLGEHYVDGHDDQHCFRDSYYNRRLIWLISQIDGVEIATKELAVSLCELPANMLCFKHPWGDGILMPIKKRPGI